MLQLPVPTIGASVALGPRETGRVGENLAAFYLGVTGFDATIVDRSGSDIWCQAPSGKLFTVEVKTCTSSRVHDHGHSLRYGFRILNKKADQFVLVSLEKNLCRIFSRQELCRRWTGEKVCPSKSEFTYEKMLSDFETLARTYQ